MRLHLGCGHDKREGYLNCDVSEAVNPDKIVDLEKELPFESDSVDEILAIHVLEHVRNFTPLMHEFRRVCKKGSVIKIVVPFFSNWGQYNDPTHVRTFTPFTFDYFRAGPYSHQVKAEKDMFDIERVRLNFVNEKHKVINAIVNPIINFNHKVYCRFFAWIFPVAEIEFRIRVLK